MNSAGNGLKVIQTATYFVLGALLAEAVREATSKPLLAFVAIELFLTRLSAVHTRQQCNQILGCGSRVHGDSVQGQEGADLLCLTLVS